MINDIVKKATENNLNIYSIAIMDESGLQEKRIHPADLCTNSYSVAKAFTVTAIGMLWSQHKICVEDKVYHILGSEFPEKYDSKWKDVTIEHLLTHTTGFGRGFLDIDVENISDYPCDDFQKIVLTEPLPHIPGTHFEYTDAAFYLLSRIVSKISGKRLDDFLRPILFEKLGYQELAWSTCPHGFCMGATGLYLRTADMVKLGYVYANEGRYYGETILSPDWVRLVLNRGYEFKQYNDTGIYAKGGMFGQMLCFSPEKHEAYAWHAYECNNDVGILLETL